MNTDNQVIEAKVQGEMSTEDAMSVLNADKSERERKVQEGLQALLKENNCEIKILVQGMVNDDGSVRFGKQLQIVAK